jgi:hypothetical protein
LTSHPCTICCTAGTKDDLVEHENDTVVTTRRVIAHEVNVGDEDAVLLGAARDGLEDDGVGFFTHCEVSVFDLLS